MQPKHALVTSDSSQTQCCGPFTYELLRTSERSYPVTSPVSFVQLRGGGGLHFTSLTLS